MLVKSQNGWPALGESSPLLYTWVIPARNGTFKLKMHNGKVGLVLAHLALSLSEMVEDATTGKVDDWGWAYRSIRGDTEMSNHASGTAFDFNALKHALGVRRTWTSKQVDWIENRLTWLKNVVRWGGDYTRRADEMHFEIVQGLREVSAVAHMLASTPRGKRILAANPSQKKLVSS